MRRLLLVDFDGTLFNSDLFHKDIASFLNSTYMLPVEDFFEAFEAAKKDGFPHNLKKQLKIIGFRNVNGLIKEIKQHLLTNSSNYIYPDTHDFINKYKKEIVVFTYADPTYYKFKLAITALNKYRLPVVAVQEDKNTFLAKNLEIIRSVKGKGAEKVYWIDDKTNVFKSSIQNVNFVRIKRENSKYSNQDTPKDVREIANLLDIE